MSEPIITKTCRVCNQIKPLSEYYKQIVNKDGYKNDCKTCYLKHCKKYKQTKNGKAVQKRYRQKSENFKAYQKQYRQSEIGKAVQVAAHNRYYLRHPGRKKAKDVVSTATQRGKMPRVNTLQCYYCPAQAEHYHHHSYEPECRLDVIPVCRKCHKKIHNIITEPKVQYLSHGPLH